MTLVEFLLARIAEDEAVARGVLCDYAQHKPTWDTPSTGVVDVGDPGLDGLLPLGDGPLAHHVARHDPARVLAECEAKRRIVEELSRFLDNLAAFGAENEAPTLPYGIRRQLQHLASVYADHPDFRAEWAL